MAVYLAPGVYVEEVDLKPPSIEGVSLSTAGFVGATLRGPSTGRPVLVTSAPDFRRQFGGAFPVSSPAAAAGELPLAVDGFFANGGSVLYVVRVAPAGTTAAAITTQGGMVTRLVSTAPAAVGATTFRPTTLRGLRDGVDITFSMVNNGVTYTSAPVAIAVGGIDRALGTVTLAAPITMTPAGGPSSFLPALTTVTSNANGVAAGTGAITTGGRPASLTLNAASGGSWGNDLAVSVQTGSAAGSEYVALLAAAVDANQVQVKSTAGFYLLAWVEIDRGSGADRTYHQVRAINGPVLTLSGAVMTAAANLDPNPGTGKTMISTCEFSVAARYGTTVERFTGLTLENVPGRSVAQVLAGSGLIAVDAASLAAIAGTDPLHFPSGDDGLNLLVTTPGADAAPAATDIRGTDNGPGHRTGIQALLDIPSIGIIAAPGWGDQQVQQALIDQCELLRYRVALLDPELSGGVGPNIQTVIDQRKRFDTKYAALYYPRIVVATPDGNRPMGPSGHMAGLIARIDNLRGVFKTPANETINGILDVEALIHKAEQEVLNPEPNYVNAIRDFRTDGRGIRVYGGRVITSDNDWKYLAVRRLFIFLEKSIDIGTQWAVFEPNGPQLWGRLIDSIDVFLTRVWKDGALLGLTKDQAFFISCGPATMSQDDIDNGRLIMEIGVAPVKPAEFVIIRISQTASGALV